MCVGIEPLVKTYKGKDGIKWEEGTETNEQKKKKKAWSASQWWEEVRTNREAKVELSCDAGHKE